MSCVFPSHVSTPSGNDGTVGSGKGALSHDDDLKIPRSSSSSLSNGVAVTVHSLPVASAQVAAGPASPKRGNYTEALLTESGAPRELSANGSQTETPSPPPSLSSKNTTKAGRKEGKSVLVYVYAVAVHILLGFAAVGALVLATQLLL